MMEDLELVIQVTKLLGGLIVICLLMILIREAYYMNHQLKLLRKKKC